MKSMYLMRRMYVLLILFLLATFFCGCANLSAIREFADISSKTAEYTKLVDDYVESPSRQKKYQPPNQHSELDKITKKRSEQKAGLFLRYSLIEEYMDALGQLAADEVVTYDKEVDSLSAAAKGGKFVDDKESKAFSAVGKLLVTAVTNSWRQKKLKQLIKESNEPLQIVIDSLKQIVNQGFAGDLEIEKTAITKYYRAIIADSHDKAGIAALEEWKGKKLSTIISRDNAIKTYSKALNKISKGHQKLYDNKDKVASKELMGQMSRYAKDLRKAYDALKDL